VENLYKHALSFKKARHNIIGFYRSFINLIRKNEHPLHYRYSTVTSRIYEYCDEISLLSLKEAQVQDHVKEDSNDTYLAYCHMLDSFQHSYVIC
jgi:endoglucanase Acf2